MFSSSKTLAEHGNLMQNSHWKSAGELQRKIISMPRAHGLCHQAWMAIHHQGLRRIF